jgi:hypothetical protein
VIAIRGKADIGLLPRTRLLSEVKRTSRNVYELGRRPATKFAATATMSDWNDCRHSHRSKILTQIGARFHISKNTTFVRRTDPRMHGVIPNNNRRACICAL